MPSSTIKDTIGADKYEEIRQIVQQTFPSDTVGDEQVDAFIISLWRDQRAAYDKLGLPPLDDSKLPREWAPSALELMGPHTDPVTGFDDRIVEYYTLTAHHARSTTTHHAPEEQMRSAFTSTVHGVRFGLPPDLTEGPDVDTRIGGVDLERHLLCGTIKRINKHFAKFDKLGFAPVERVEVLTCAKRVTRFAPISIYLCYTKKDAARPAFYILESGTAWGQPAQVYFGPTFGTPGHDDAWTPEYCSDFNPTLVSDNTNRYVARLELDAKGEHPVELRIHSRISNASDPVCECPVGGVPEPERVSSCPIPGTPTKQPATASPPYIKIKIDFVRGVQGHVAASHQYEAAVRAGTIAEAMHAVAMAPAHGPLIPGQGLAGLLARTVSWDCFPTLGEKCVK